MAFADRGRLIAADSGADCPVVDSAVDAELPVSTERVGIGIVRSADFGAGGPVGVQLVSPVGARSP